MENGEKSNTPSRIRRFFAFLSAGYSVRTATDRTRQERTRLRTARTLALWQKTHLRRILCRLRDTLFMTELRALALFLAPMALAATFRCLLLPLLTDDFPLLPYDGAAGVLLLLLSLLLSTYKTPLYRAVTEDRLLSHLCFSTLALPRPYITMARGIGGLWLFLLGLLPAALSVFISPFLLTMILLGALLLVLTFASPEFALLLLGGFFPLSILSEDPFLPLGIVLTVTLLSYLFKLLLGKRDFHLEPIGFFLLVFVAINLIFSYSGSPSTFLAPLKLGVVAICGYFLTQNLLATKHTAVLFSRGMIFSATLLSALAIFSEIFTLLPAHIEQGRITRYLLALNARFFPSGDILAAYLILLLPLLIGLLADSKEARLRLIPALLILLAALVLSISPLALVALILALVLFTMLSTGSRAGLFFLLTAVLPNAILLLPQGLCDRIASLIPVLGIDRMMSERLALLRASLATVTEHPFGLGVGAAEGASLYLGIGMQSGIPGMLALIAMLAFMARDALRTTGLEGSNRHRTLPHGCACSLFAVLIYAPFQNIFADIRIALLFFLMAGMLTAVCRIGWLEDEFHRRHMQDDDHQSYATELRVEH